MNSMNDHPHAELYAYLNDTLSRWFFHLVNEKITLLDFGCGDAFLTNYIQKSFHEAHIIGVDTDYDQLKKNIEQYPEISFMPLIRDLLPFDDCSVNILYSVNVFHHIKEDERNHFACELVRVLKPGGVLVIFETNPYNWSARKTFYAEHDKEAVMLSLNYVKSLFTFNSCTSKGLYLYPNISYTMESILKYIPFGSLYAVIVTKKNK